MEHEAGKSKEVEAAHSFGQAPMTAYETAEARGPTEAALDHPVPG
jgi:hypothetical protein